MSQSSSNQSSLRSAGSTPLEAISEDETAATLTLPSPALAFATGKHLHSVKQAYQKPPMPKAPSLTPSPKMKSQKKAITKEDRMAMLLQFTSERDDDDAPFRLPPPKQLPDYQGDRTTRESHDEKKSIFRRMSDKLGNNH